MQKVKAHSYVLITILLFIFSFSLAVLSIQDKTVTEDEARHLVRGLVFLESGGDMRINQHNPWLGNVIQSLPSYFFTDHQADKLITTPQWEFADKDWLASLLVEYNGGFEEFSSEVLQPSRYWMIFINFAIVGISTTLLYQWKNPKIATIFAAVLLTSTTFIAHSRLITTDTFITQLIFLTTIVFWRGLKQNSWKWLGLAFGLAMVSINVKFSGLFMLFILSIIYMIYRFKVLEIKSTFVKVIRVFTEFGYICLFTFITLLVLHAGSFNSYFETKFLSPDSNQAQERITNSSAKISSTFGVDLAETESKVEDFLTHTDIPVSYYFIGFFDNVILNNFEWHGAFLLEKNYEPGVYLPHYFPIAFGLKETLVHVGIAVYMLGYFVYQTYKKLRYDRGRIANLDFIQDSPLWLVPIFLLTLIMASTLNLGVRHTQPLVPFLGLWFGVAINSVNFKSYYEKGALAVVAVYIASTLLIAFPNYIPYFNELIPRNPMGSFILVSSNYHWRQNLGIVNDYKEKNSATLNPSNFSEVDTDEIIINPEFFHRKSFIEDYKKLKEAYRDETIEPIKIIEDTHLVFKTKDILELYHIQSD